MAQRKPFLAYMITSSSHHPFEVPSKYHVLNVGELEGTNEGNYLHAVHYFDQAFGEFIDELRMNGLLEESLVVLYGDHQAFLDGTRLGGLLGSGKLSQYDSFQLRKRVPLLIRLPERLLPESELLGVVISILRPRSSAFLALSLRIL